MRVLARPGALPRAWARYHSFVMRSTRSTSVCFALETGGGTKAVRAAHAWCQVPSFSDTLFRSEVRWWQCIAQSGVQPRASGKLNEYSSSLASVQLGTDGYPTLG